MKLIRYTLYVLIPLVLISSGTSYFVDPYGVRNNNTVNLKYSDLSKVSRLRSSEADAVVLGSDSVYHGIAFPSLDGKKNLFNFSTPNSGLYEAFRLLKFSNEELNIKEAIISLEFSMFNSHFMGKENEYDDFSISDGLGASLKRIWRLYFSPVAFMDSLDAIGKSERNYIGKDGVLNSKISSPVGSGGYYNNFISEERYYLTSGYFPAGPKRFDFRSLEKDIESFDYVDQIVEYARDNDIKLIFFIPPYHGRHIELIYSAGILSEYQDWKRRLVSTVSDYNNLHSELNVRIYDFSGGSFSYEEVPLNGDVRSEMISYWSGTKYKQALGSQIIELILTNEVGSDYELNSENIEDAIDQQAVHALSFRSVYAQAVEDIQIIEADTSYSRPVKEYDVQLIEAAIELMLAGDVDEQSVVEQVGYESLEEFNSVLSEYYGVNFHQFHSIVDKYKSARTSMAKLAKAKLLLTNTYLTPKKIAKLVGYGSTGDFNSDFRTHNSKTPLQYRLLNGGNTLRDLSRVEIAKNLLETTSLDMLDVVDGSGFGSLSAMKKLFKEETGLLPNEYRERNAGI